MISEQPGLSSLEDSTSNPRCSRVDLTGRRTSQEEGPGQSDPASVTMGVARKDLGSGWEVGEAIWGEGGREMDRWR